MIFWLLTQWARAECGDGLSVRYSVPSYGTGNWPVSVKPLVSFLGNGSELDVSLSLVLVEGDQVTEIPTQQEAGCYGHESSTEKHCNWHLVPDEDLQENSYYEIRILPTTHHPEQGWTYDIDFTTGSSRASKTVDPPQLDLLKYGPRDDFGIDECDWQDAYSYEIWAYPQTSDTLKSYLNVYEVTDSGSEIYQHAIFIEPNMSVTDFRQVLEPGTEGPRCYYVQHHLITGEYSAPSEVLCHDGSIFPPSETDNDEEVEDSAVSSDAPEEQEPQEESEQQPSRKKGGTTVEVEQGGGCGSDGASLVLLPLFLFGIRNRGIALN